MLCPRPAADSGTAVVVRGPLREAPEEGCTWERRTSPDRDSVLIEIPQFCSDRQGQLMCSHVRVGGSAHMGAHQLVLMDVAKQQKHGEKRPPPRRIASLPCASRLHSPLQSPSAGRGPSPQAPRMPARGSRGYRVGTGPTTYPPPRRRRQDDMLRMGLSTATPRLEGSQDPRQSSHSPSRRFRSSGRAFMASATSSPDPDAALSWSGMIP